MKIGELIEESKETVPVIFNSKWVDPVKNSGGNRSVDYLNFLLYQLPTCFVPNLSCKRTQVPLLNLIKACQLCSEWSILSQDLELIETYFKNWLMFLKSEVENQTIHAGVLKPTQHYLLHVVSIIRSNGPLKVYSASSMERAIGKYKKLVKSKSSVGENAANVLLRLTTRSYICNLPWSLPEVVSLLMPRPYNDASYEQHPIELIQLWRPFVNCSLSNLPLDVPEQKFVHALSKFFARSRPADDEIFDFLPVTSIYVASRAWAYNKVYSSKYYAEMIHEHRRGNHYIMFEATHKK